MYACAAFATTDETSTMLSTQYWDEDRGLYNVAGHEDDEQFKSQFWLRVLNSLCDPG